MKTQREGSCLQARRETSPEEGERGPGEKGEGIKNYKLIFMKLSQEGTVGNTVNIVIVTYGAYVGP